MSFLHNCLSYLDSFGVPYRHIVDSRAPRVDEIAAAESVSAYALAKTVLCEGDELYLLVVLPEAWYVDVRQVGLVAGARRVRIATADEIAVLFPFSEMGAVPPFGGLIGLPVYLDRQLAEQEFIAFNAGSGRDLIHMKTADFKRVAQTTTGTFGCRDYQAEFRRTFLAARKAAGRIACVK
jgi:Ala-tRNA(Pro) deacylase